MSYAAVIVILLAVGAIAGMLAWFTRTRFRMEALRRHHEIGSAVFLQLGVIFAVLLAFVFNEVWSEPNTAASAINSECSNLRAAVVPPPPSRRRKRNAWDKRPPPISRP